MRVRMGLLQRQPDLTPAAFRRHWRDVHGPLAALLPGLLRYQQNHLRAAVAMPGIAPGNWPLDGISALWFDPGTDMLALAATPAYRAVAADEPRCMLPSRVIVAHQHAVARAGANGVKVMALLTRQEGASEEAFAAAWLASAPAGAVGCTLSLVRDRMRGGTPIDRAAAPVDAVLELWFDGTVPDAIEVPPPARAITAAATAWRCDVHVVVQRDPPPG